MLYLGQYNILYYIYTIMIVQQFKYFSSTLSSIHETSALRPEAPLLYLTSTFFDGQHPSLARKSFEVLRGNYALRSQMRGLQFAVFGVGNSAFTWFCRAAYVARDEFVGYGAEEILAVQRFDRKGVDDLERALRWFCEQMLAALGW
ncbi:Flavodoxin [Spironucleus salmonicida]|uniref:Flavodoxin n=2 Tax=Spironucleus salmonicida TaxID=348837 RepID=A0A9P8RY97_9EUKA|nr:Flavodoxin [Spironucleus salmonicida]